MDRSHVAGILNKHVEEYLQEAAADLRITDANIHDKTILRSAIRSEVGSLRTRRRKIYEKT